MLRRTRYALRTGLVLAFGVHLAFSQLGGLGEEQKITKPLTTRFVKRQPRFTRPFEMRKHPQPKRRRMQRRMVSVKAKANPRKVTSRIQPLQAMPHMGKPKTQADLFLTMRDVGREPGVFAEPVIGRMNPEDVVDMSLEMVDVEALDTGRYQAMVIQDPNDKRNITGYFHFWMPWGLSYADRTTSGHSKWYWVDCIRHGVRRVVLKLNEWTDIKADIKGVIEFGSAELLDTPWVVLAHLFKMYPTDGELNNICRYMHTGGFVFTQGDPETDNRGLRFAGEQIRGGCTVVRLALEHGGYTESREWAWQPLPHSHAIFHCYFDFPGGPPPGGANLYAGLGWLARDPGPPRIDAIEIGGQIAAITSNTLYTECWGRWGPGAFPWYANKSWFSQQDPTRALQFGVNTIIFALTQEGSITHRLMTSVR